jgi:hypothetical protein
MTTSPNPEVIRNAHSEQQPFDAVLDFSAHSP